jgi:hypothetical protein
VLAPVPVNVTLVGDPAIVAGADRTLTVLCRDAQGRMHFSRQDSPHSGAGWSDWAFLGLKTLVGDPSAVTDPAGVVRVFATGQSSTRGLGLFEIAETVPDDSWETDWTEVVAGAPPADGRRVSAAVRGTDVVVSYLDIANSVQQLTRAAGSWSAHGLGGPFTSYPSIAANGDGRLEVFAKFRNDLLQHRWQNAAITW